MQPTEDAAKPSDSGAFLLRRGLVLLLVSLFAGLILFRGIAVVWHYNEAVRGGHEQAEKLAHLLSEHLQQSFATLDATFAHLADYSTQVGGPAASPGEWSKVLSAGLAGLKAINRISVVGRDGIIRHSTRATLVGSPREDAPLFRLLAASKDMGLVALGATRDPDNGRLNFPVARALTGRTGEFDGIVIAHFDAQLLDHFYRGIQLGAQSVVSIFTNDGEVIYRYGRAGPLDPLRAAVRSLPEKPNLDHLGSHTAHAPIDTNGEPYFTAIHTVGSLPLAIVVSLPEAGLLGAWRKEVLLSVLVLGTVAVLFLAGGVLMMRALRAHAAADAAMKKNEARFYEIIYRAPIFASVKDTQGRVRFINKALEELFRTTWKEATGKRLREVDALRTGPADIVSALDQEVIETTQAIQRELTYPTPEGTRTAMFVKFPLLDENGEIDAIASFSVDLTAQRRAATWFSTIMDHAPAMITLKDMDGRFVFANRAVAEASGRQVSDFLGRRTSELFAPAYAAFQEQFERDVIEARAPIQRELNPSITGDDRTLLFVKFPIFDAKGNVESIGSIATDVTEQKRSEQRLAHAQRMEAVGQLTGGIAHDFNNLLTVMIGNSELLNDELADNERLRPLARVTLEAAERGATLTQRLLAFGRRQMLEPRSIDVRRLVEDMEALCQRAAGGRAQVQVVCLEENLWPAMVDASQLETAIINLVVNSRDAMPGGGRVVIEMANVEIDQAYTELNPDARPGDYVAISVSDTGTGMPPEVVARAFEPFFTTKEPGKGTGLGLPTIYGFVRQSGGHIKIQSEVGLGTVVNLYIPRADGPGVVPAMDAGAAEGLPRGGESILLVEDDRIVRDYTEQQLTDLGYRVTAAAGPEEALKLSRLTGRPDLVITDIVMEGSMNGRQLAERLRGRWPDVRVLFVSGYTDGALPELSGGLGDGMFFLPKPFHRRDLALKVREALEGQDLRLAAVS